MSSKMEKAKFLLRRKSTRSHVNTNQETWKLKLWVWLCVCVMSILIMSEDWPFITATPFLCNKPCFNIKKTSLTPSCAVYGCVKCWDILVSKKKPRKAKRKLSVLAKCFNYSHEFFVVGNVFLIHRIFKHRHKKMHQCISVKKPLWFQAVWWSPMSMWELIEAGPLPSSSPTTSVWSRLQSERW